MGNVVPLPPQAVAAEQSVIGGCLLDASALDTVRGILLVDDFYDHRHKIVFNAMLQMATDGNGIDALLVDEYLKVKGLSNKVGGLAYLGELAMNTASIANIAHYAAIVREKSVLRLIIAAAKQMTEQAMSGGGSVRDIIAGAEKTIFELGQQGLRGKRGFVAIREPLGLVVDAMEAAFDAPPKSGVRGQASGFADLDAKTSGFMPGNLVVIAARPGMGKTSFAMNIAEHIALVDGKPVAVFSMEMTKEELAERTLVSVSGMPLQRAKMPWKLQDDDWVLMSAGLSKLAKSPVYIDDTPGLTIGQLRSRLMRLVSELSTEYPNGLGGIVIDYIQLMGGEGGSNENRNGQIEVISRGLKQIAKELSVPVFALSQLNRNVESRPNKRPIMSDLRDSGSIEQDADTILFLYRDEVYNRDSVDKGIAEVVIGKQRSGPLGVVRLAFDGECVRFRNLAAGYVAYEDDY